MCSTGSLANFSTGTPFVEINWAKGLTSEGRPIPADASTVTEGGRVTKPGVIGGVNWQPAAFNPALGLIFVPAIEGQSVFTKSAADRVTRGEKGILCRAAADRWSAQLPKWYGHWTPPRAPNDGSTTCAARERATAIGGMLATAGGLVFGTSGGSLFALDAATGKELWSVGLGGDTWAPPITFTSEGRQVIAVLAGRAMFVFGL